MLLQKLFFFAVMNPLYAAGLQWATQVVNTKTSSNSTTSIYVVKAVHSHSHRLYLKLNKEKKVYSERSSPQKVRYVLHIVQNNTMVQNSIWLKKNWVLSRACLESYGRLLRLSIEELIVGTGHWDKVITTDCISIDAKYR